MKRSGMMLAAALAVVGAGAAEPSPPLVIAERGQPAKYTIVIEKDASDCLRFAAEELSLFISRQTGVKLPITEGEASPAIVLRECITSAPPENPIKADGFHLRAVPPNVFIAGAGARGVLYGVYELLERFGACAWYSPSFEVVPRQEKFSVPGNLDEIQAPAFALRSLMINGWNTNHVHAARNKLNLEGFGERLGGSDFRFDPVLGKCHTFEKLLPAAKWFDTHPEYFSERNGRRLGYRTQLCLTNPEVLRLCTEKTLARIAESYPKGIRRFGISPNDWGAWCECAECARVDGREKSHAGTLIDFVNRIAEAVEKKYPEAIIQTLAYTYTRRPPATLVPRKNVQICFCTIECDFAQPIAMGRAIENRAVRHALAQWAKYPSRLSVWDYAGDFACYQHIWPNFRSLRENIRLFRASGVDEMFEQGTGGGQEDIWADLRAWCIAKWLWNPDLELEWLLRKCFADCFGPAAEEVYRYCKLVHDTPRDTKRYPMRCFESVYACGISAPMLDSAAALMAQARERAAGTKFADNVRRASLPVDFMRAMRGYARPSMASAAMDPARLESEREGARRVAAALNSPASLRLADDSVWEALLARRLRQFADADKLPPPSKRLSFEEWAFTGTMPVAFRIEDDPLAGDGRAVHLPGNLAHCSCWFELDSVAIDPEATYMPRLRLRVGKSAPRTPTFFAGIYNLNLRKVVSGMNCRREELPPGKAQAGEAYFWYNVGAIQPKRGDVVWVALGGGAEHPDVWIDKIELRRMPAR